jgi:hypothetical protein
MATYTELYNLYASGSSLLARFEVACMVAAHNILNESAGTPNHANRVIWANAVLEDSKAMSNRMLRRAISSNATLQAQGEAISDNDVQYICNSFVDTFATGAV